MVQIRCFCNVIRSEYVVLDSLSRCLLHKRNMLMRRRMENYIRSFLRADPVDAFEIAHRADIRNDFHFLVEMQIDRQLADQIVHVILINIKQNKTARPEAGSRWNRRLP